MFVLFIIYHFDKIFIFSLGFNLAVGNFDTQLQKLSRPKQATGLEMAGKNVKATPISAVLLLGTKMPKHLCLYRAEQLSADVLPICLYQAEEMQEQGATACSLSAIAQGRKKHPDFFHLVGSVGNKTLIC